MKRTRRSIGADGVSRQARLIARQTGQPHREVERRLRGEEQLRFKRRCDYALAAIALLYVAIAGVIAFKPG